MLCNSKMIKFDQILMDMEQHVSEFAKLSIIKTTIDIAIVN